MNSADHWRAIWRFIWEYQHVHRFAPTYQEIADGVGLRSRASVHKHIGHLVAHGIIERRPSNGRSRNIRLLINPPGVTRPLLGGDTERRLAKHCQARDIDRATAIRAAVEEYLDRQETVSDPTDPAATAHRQSSSGPAGGDARAPAGR